LEAEEVPAVDEITQAVTLLALMAVMAACSLLLLQEPLM